MEYSRASRSENVEHLPIIGNSHNYQQEYKVVEKAIEFHLRYHAEAEEARRALLNRKGAWTREEAERTRAAVEELRKQWAGASSQILIS